MKRIFLLICLFLFVSGCALPPNLDELHPVGTKYTGEINLEEKKIPLPDGEWEMAACGTRKQFFSAYLVKRCKNKKFNILYIKVDKPYLDRKYGYVNSPYYRKKIFHHSVVKNNTAGKAQDAWGIRNTSMGYRPAKNNPIYNNLLKYLTANNFSLDKFFIQIQHRFTSWGMKKDFIYMSYYLNPSTEGLSSKRLYEWDLGSIDDHPEKVAFIDYLKIVGEKQHSDLKKGL